MFSTMSICLPIHRRIPIWPLPLMPLASQKVTVGHPHCMVCIFTNIFICISNFTSHYSNVVTLETHVLGNAHSYLAGNRSIVIKSNPEIVCEGVWCHMFFIEDFSTKISRTDLKRNNHYSLRLRFICYLENCKRPREPAIIFVLKYTLRSELNMWGHHH